MTRLEVKIADIAVRLLSDAASRLTGSVIAIDGAKLAALA